MGTATQPTTSSVEELSNRYAVVFAVPENSLLDLAIRATAKAVPEKHEAIIKECARALKQRLDMEERNNLTELISRYAILESIKEKDLSSLVNKAISGLTPVSQYEKIVAHAAKSVKAKKALELAKKKEESKNLD